MLFVNFNALQWHLLRAVSKIPTLLSKIPTSLSTIPTPFWGCFGGKDGSRSERKFEVFVVSVLYVILINFETEIKVCAKAFRLIFEGLARCFCALGIRQNCCNFSSFCRFACVQRAIAKYTVQGGCCCRRAQIYIAQEDVLGSPF